MWLTLYKWLHARYVLGIALARHLWRNLWQQRAQDGARWLTSMQQEGLGATAAANWPRYEAASRCIGCGWCDQIGDAQLAQPSLWMQGAPRQQVDATELAAVAAALRARRDAIAALCPTGADAAAVADVLDQHRATLPPGSAPR